MSQQRTAPIRVLVVGPTVDTFPGGVAIQAAILADRFNQSDATVRLELVPITPRVPTPLRLLQRIPVVRTIVTTMVYLGSLIKRIPGASIVHVNSARFSSFVISSMPAVVIGRLMGRPVILHYHNGDLRRELARYRPVFGWLLRWSDLIVVPSRFLATVLAEVGLPSRVIANQVDVERFKFRERVPLLPKFVSCRHFEDLYDIPTLLRAFQAVQSKIPAAELVLAGKGSLEPQVRRLAAELQLEHVTFVGQLDPPKVAQLFDDGGILLNSSAIDNTPASLIEAFAAGLPVVSTDAGGIPFIVDQGRTGRLVPIHDAAGLAREALDLLAHPEEAVKMTTRARAVAETEFTWEVVRGQWLTTYQDLAHGRKA